MIRNAASVGLLLLTCASASAQPSEGASTAESASTPKVAGMQAFAPERQGAYPGVTPGSGAPPPGMKSPASTRAAVATWPGFQMQPDGSSRFFVQVTKPVTTETRSVGQETHIVFKGVRVPLKNNQRPLVTQYFNTPVTRAKFEPRGRDAVLVLQMRASATPNVTSEVGPGGYHFVFVTFPRGDYAPTTSTGARPLDPVPAPASATSVTPPESSSPKSSTAVSPAPAMRPPTPAPVKRTRITDSEKPPALGGTR